MDHTKDAIAVLDGFDRNAYGDEVVDLVEGLARVLDLLPDRIDMLRPTGYLRPDANSLELFHQDLADLGDEDFTLPSLAVDELDDLPIGVSVEMTEGQVLELPLDLPHAEAVS